MQWQAQAMREGHSTCCSKCTSGATPMSAIQGEQGTSEAMRIMDTGLYSSSWSVRTSMGHSILENCSITVHVDIKQPAMESMSNQLHDLCGQALRLLGGTSNARS